MHHWVKSTKKLKELKCPKKIWKCTKCDYELNRHANGLNRPPEDAYVILKSTENMKTLYMGRVTAWTKVCSCDEIMIYNIMES